MRAIDLAIKDLKQLVRNRMTAFFLVIMPVVFTLMFGFAFGGFGGQQDPRLPVGFVDQDGSRLSASLLDLLAASDAIRPVELKGRDTNPERVDKVVQDEDYAAVVIVPAGYGQGLRDGQLPRLQIVADESSQAATPARIGVEAAASRLAGAVEAARLSEQAYADAAGLADDAARQVFFEAALAQAVAAWREPPLTVAVGQSGAIVEEEGSEVMQSGFSHASPSMMVQFAIAGLIGAATVLILERKSGALRRLLTTAISRFEIILGHYLAMVIMILGQLAILVAFGQLALGVDYMRAPLATLMLMLTTSLWTAALGLLIGTLAETEERAIIYSLVAMFLLAGVGGAWMPLEFTGETFQAIGHLLPSAWAMDGFENIVVRGLGLESVWLPVGIMLAYGVALLILAAWRFRFE
ncbi:MAG: ABC transporter permease [Chloroflexota bacterium]